MVQYPSAYAMKLKYDANEAIVQCKKGKGSPYSVADGR